MVIQLQFPQDSNNYGVRRGQSIKLPAVCYKMWRMLLELKSKKPNQLSCSSLFCFYQCFFVKLLNNVNILRYVVCKIVTLRLLLCHDQFIMISLKIFIDLKSLAWRILHLHGFPLLKWISFNSNLSDCQRVYVYIYLRVFWSMTCWLPPVESFI